MDFYVVLFVMSKSGTERKRVKKKRTEPDSMWETIK